MFGQLTTKNTFFLGRFLPVSLICSLGGPLSQGYPAVVFLADRGHPCFCESGAKWKKQWGRERVVLGQEPLMAIFDGKE